MSNLIPFIYFDREIRFDVSKGALKCQAGEEEIDYIPEVEDTKGNNGAKGGLKVTNLRIIWFSHQNSAIGHNCVKDMYIRTSDSILKGKTQSLFISTVFEKSKLEFIFTNYGVDSPRLFSTAQTVVRAYETSRTYRDLRIRGSVIKDDQLRLLKDEKIISRISGIWNKSSSQRHIGTIHTTNIRVVWHANATPNYNVSIPLIIIKNASYLVDDNQPSLLIETIKHVGGHQIYFQSDNAERMSNLAKEINSLFQICLERPIYGVEFVVDDHEKPVVHVPIKRAEDEYVMEKDEVVDVFSQYSADTSQQRDRPPVYVPSLGLAVEALPEGYTVEKVWDDLLETAKLALETDKKGQSGLTSV